MKLSLSSFVYLNYPLDEAVRRIARAGYAGIDIWGGRPHCYRRDLSEKELLSLRMLIQDEGLEVASFIPAQFRYPTCLCSPIQAVRTDSVRYIQDSIETAAALGAKIVSICPGHTLYGQTQADGLGRLAESVWEIATFAGRHSVSVVIEPADAYETDLLTNVRQTVEFLAQFDELHLGVLLDNGHEFVTCGNYDIVPHLGGRPLHVHIDDNNGERDQHLIPGLGRSDVPGFLKKVHDLGYDGYMCVELGWDYTTNPDFAAGQSIDYLRTLLPVENR